MFGGFLFFKSSLMSLKNMGGWVLASFNVIVNQSKVQILGFFNLSLDLFVIWIVYFSLDNFLGQRNIQADFLFCKDSA